MELAVVGCRDAQAQLVFKQAGLVCKLGEELGKRCRGGGDLNGVSGGSPVGAVGNRNEPEFYAFKGDGVGQFNGECTGVRSW